MGINSLKEPYRTLVQLLVKKLGEVLGDKLVSIVVYSSVARGDARKSSDIDILVIADDLPRFLRRSRRLLNRYSRIYVTRAIPRISPPLP